MSEPNLNVFSESDSNDHKVPVIPTTTILLLIGFDCERLTSRHGGRDFRLTDVAGNVVK
jgi:hypothetical protein